MLCKEALNYWQQELLGLPVDRAALEEAYAHIGACQDLCARTLGAAPSVVPLTTAEQRSGQTDLYETLGLSAEEEGDAHALRWHRLAQRAKVRAVSQDALDFERAMALASWQAAATYYQDGLRIGKTDLLIEGVARIKQKRLDPTAPPDDQFPGSKGKRPTRGVRHAGASSPDAEKPPPPAQAMPARAAFQTLVLVGQPEAGRITVAQFPDGWQVGSPASGSRLVVSETASLYTAPSRYEWGPERSPALGQPQVEGPLGGFAVALWASALTRRWELEVLVRARSAQHPWRGFTLTLEDQEQGRGEPELMEFARRTPHMTGWWTRFREVAAGSYQVRFSANDANGQPLEDATLGLRLALVDQVDR